MPKNLLLFCSVICMFFACGKDSDNSPGTEACRLSVAETLVVEQLNNEFAYPIADADPNTIDPGLTPLLDYLGEAHFVGLGEATHGTAEFYRFKDKLFRELVLDKNFKAIIFEIPWGNALVVNEFVTQGIGSVDEVVDQTFYWTYDTQEVRNLVSWMRAYNEGRAPADMIHFVGCDPQGANFAIEQRVVADFLTEVAPDSMASLLENYNSLPTNLEGYAEAMSVHAANWEGTQTVYQYLVDNEASFTAQTSDTDYQIALMAAHLIWTREEIYRTSDFGETRDALMAEYVEWWQSIYGASSKVAIWAHNSHVMNGAYLNVNWMGTYLKRRHGEDYLNLGFSFGKGSFNAFLANREFGFLAGLRRQSIPEFECGTTNFLLSEVAGDQHYLIFSELDGDSREYFNQEQNFLQFGAGFNYNFVELYTQSRRLSRLFDVLVHFDQTTESILR